MTTQLPASQQINPQQIGNMLVDGMILQQMSKFTNTDTSLSMNNIGKLILVLSLQELKKYLVEALDSIKINIKPLFLKIIELFKNGINFKQYIISLVIYSN
jgi:hypothetical protein